MTYPITVYGVEYKTTRGWVPVERGIRETEGEANDLLADLASTNPHDEHRLRVNELHITPAKENA